ncbi:putative cytokinetic ring protein SteA [Nocardioides sp.]|uniref:putative cytokinetic ring protein SteA n=1 Tax=Nocardioides sp. TaxID=35761 RepID=UPI002D7E5D8D|nr:putative cytokinetic ring protein SteA [Nocardioides sp.]HET8960622.1 putative cytokinetic ring protein SteA [Nocardioides sp.]
MKPATRSRPGTTEPGLTGIARVERRTRALLPRLRPGDVAVLDHLDMDRATAQALVDAGVSAVLNAAPMISGRFPNLGPQVLAEAGILVLDNVEGAFGIADGAPVRVYDEVVFADGAAVAMGREVDAHVVDHEMALARAGLGSQLETFTHNSTEFLRREEALLLHGLGLPETSTRIADRPVVVVAAGKASRRRLASIEAFIREQQPVLVGVDGGADLLLDAGHRPDIVVLSNAAPDAERPSAKSLRAARDVVVRVDGGGRLHAEQLERLGVRPLPLESSATSEDTALLLLEAENARLIVGVGLHARLEEVLDRQNPGLAGTYLTRLKVGHLLVDASSVHLLYSGRVRPRHLFLVLVAGLLALAVAVAVTPVGQEWLTGLTDYLQGLSR